MCHHVAEHHSITVQNVLGMLRTMSYHSSCHQGDMWDAQLTSNGEEQAAALKPLMSREHVDLVVSSLVELNGSCVGASKICLSSMPSLVCDASCVEKTFAMSSSSKQLQQLQLQGSPLTRAIQTGLLASPPGHQGDLSSPD